MIVVNETVLTDLFAGFKADLARGLEMADTSWQQWAMSVPSTQAIERYPMLALLSTMRQWLGPRIIAQLAAKYLEVANNDYEHSVGVPTNTIEDEQLGLFPIAFQQMGMDATQLWPDLGSTALVSNGTWLDGTAFFSASRTLGASTIANYVTTALSATTFGTAFDTMVAYTGWNGKPLRVKPRYLMVGPANREVAHGIVNQGPGNTASNPNAGLVEPIVNPYLVGDYANYWFLLGERGAVKPVLIQKRKEGPLVALDKPTDSCVFFGATPGDEGTVPGGVNIYGVHYRGAAALSLPVLAYAGYKS